MGSTKESTAVFVKMDPQPLNPPFSARVENGELWWELNERDNWHRDDNNKPPYKPGDTVREREEWADISEILAEAKSLVQRWHLGEASTADIDAHPQIIYRADYPNGTVRPINWQPAETMPAWAIRPRVVKSIEPVMRDGAWWWRVEV